MRPFGCVQFFVDQKHHHFVAPHNPTLHLLVHGIEYTGNYLKWQAIQLAAFCRVDPLRELE